MGTESMKCRILKTKSNHPRHRNVIFGNATEIARGTTSAAIINIAKVVFSKQHKIVAKSYILPERVVLLSIR